MGSTEEILLSKQMNSVFDIFKMQDMSVQHLKEAGNKAVGKENYAEAIKYYKFAIERDSEDDFKSVLYSNRAHVLFNVQTFLDESLYYR